MPHLFQYFYQNASRLRPVLVFAVAVTLLCGSFVAVNADDRSEKFREHRSGEDNRRESDKSKEDRSGDDNRRESDKSKEDRSGDEDRRGSDKPHGRKSVDEQLRELLVAQNVAPLDPGPTQDPLKVELGRALFFDSELSGNRDIACATCHHPFFATGDGLSLPVGVGAVVPGSLGPMREIGAGRHFVPRNAPEIFNRGSRDWFSQFWDSRLVDTGTTFINPAGTALPPGLSNILAAQAMFPVTSRDEMRGLSGDFDIDGGANEIAAIADNDFQGIWNALMIRLMSIDGYRVLFAAAYPGEDIDTLGFEHAAEAIAAFEADAYTFLDSPWDKYLAGQTNALSTSQKQGALLFYGSAKCSGCHSGSLMTDQQHYNIGVPQLGPGKGDGPGLDHGRGRETGIAEDIYRFRTPPLRNCEITGPYMHNGAFSNLTEVIEHHASPRHSLWSYDPEEQIDQVEIRDTYVPAIQIDVALGIDDAKLPDRLSRRDVRDLVRFLKTLTAPDIQQRMEATIPFTVPSGLPIDGF